MKVQITATLATFIISAVESHAFDNQELINSFKAHVPTCNDAARKWIRAAYHDAGTFSSTDTTPVGSDGSLQFELDRPENNGLGPIIDLYKTFVPKFQISMADAIAFGGTVAVQVCAPGIQISFSPGRTDAKTANPPGRLPNAHFSASDILSTFRDRLGFNVNQLVALIGGAHSVAFVNTTEVGDPTIGSGSLDATPDSLDNAFFKELEAMSINKLPSDIALMGDPSMKAAVKMFARDSSALALNFASAFSQMIVLGTNQMEPNSDTSTTSVTTISSTPIIVSSVPQTSLPTTSITISTSTIIEDVVTTPFTTYSTSLPSVTNTNYYGSYGNYGSIYSENPLNNGSTNSSQITSMYNSAVVNGASLSSIFAIFAVVCLQL